MKKMTLLLAFCAVLASGCDQDPYSKSLDNNFAMGRTIMAGGNYYITEVYYDGKFIWHRITPTNEMTDSL